MKVKLIDICDFQGGSQPPKDEWKGNYINGYIRMLQIRDFTQKNKVIPEYVKISNSLKFCEADDILIARYGASVGKILTGLSGAYNVAIMKIIPDTTRLNKRYLKYFLESRSFQYFIKNVGSRAAQAGFNKSDLSSIFIEERNINEQNKIINILDKLTSLIELKKNQLEKLDLFVKSLFIEMFGDPIKNPMNWNKEKLENKCQIITGNTPSRKIDNYYGNYIEWIKSDNIDINQSIITKAVEYLSEKGLKVGRCVDNNSILMTCIAGSIKCIGNVAITNRKVAFNQQINAIVPNNQNVWFMYIQFKICQQYIQGSINMSLKGILSKSRLSELLFIFPPMKLQNQFAERVQQIDKSKLAIQQSLEQLKTLKKSLMQEYFG